MSLHPLPSGPYLISRPHEQLATILDGRKIEGSQVNILPPTGNPGEQEWHVDVKDGGKICTIRNLKSGTYLSYQGAPERGKLIGGYAEPREWILQHTDKPFEFLVIAPQIATIFKELLFDQSPLLIYPPLAALQEKEGNGAQQAWRFQFLE